MEFRYKIIDSFNLLQPYREQYDFLCSQSAADEFLFYQFGYLKCLIQLLNTHSHEVFVLILDDHDKLTAFLPLEIIKRHGIYLNSRVLRFLGTESGLLTSCYGGMVCDKSLSQEELDSVLTIMQKAILSTDMPSWNEYSFENIFMRSFPDKQKFDFLTERSINASDTYALDVNIEFDAYFQNHLSKSLRSQLRRAKKKLFHAYENVDFVLREQLSDDEYDEMDTLHTQRQLAKDTAGVGLNNILQRHFIFKHPESAEAFRKITAWAEQNQVLRCYLLRVNGKLASFLYCIKYKRKLHAIVMAINHEFSKFTPAKLLTLFAFEREHEKQEVDTIDFLADSNLFKQQMLPVITRRFILQGANPIGLKNKALWFHQKVVRLLLNKLFKH